MTKVNNPNGIFSPYQYEIDEDPMPYEEDEINDIDFDTTADVSDVESSLDDKQNLVFYDPSYNPMNQPQNPNNGDMWVDVSVTPNVIYTWNGTQWVKAVPTVLAELGGQFTPVQIPDGGITAAKMNWTTHLIF
jgi:hypothetical protein